MVRGRRHSPLRKVPKLFLGRVIRTDVGTGEQQEQYAQMRGSTRYFHERLLDAAESTIERPEADPFSYAAAISLVGTACEVAAGSAAATIVSEKALGPVAEAALSWANQFNLGDDRIRQTWNAITGDAIEDEPFWTSFTQHVVRRNAVIHTGLVAGRTVERRDAESSIEAGRALIAHIRDVLTGNGLDAYVHDPL